MQELQYTTKFKILECLATGGMGEIYLAEQLGSNGFKKDVVIKIIRGDLVSDRETLDMFIGEANLVANLIHENIIQVYNFEEIEGNYYLIMEYAAGPNLEKFMERHQFIRQKVPSDMAAFIISRIARALSYVHKKRDSEGKRLKIVHRDVSPSNVIITYQGVVKLLDFGIAKALNMKVPDERQIIMGKYSYMSPEQAKGKGTDFRSDIFSLGLVSYELITGVKVYDVNNVSLLIQAMKQPINPAKKWNPAIPEKLNEIVMKALEMDPDRRFQSAAEMRESLENFLYHRGFRPSNDKLAQYVKLLFPEARNRVS